jgi:rubredoxin
MSDLPVSIECPRCGAGFPATPAEAQGELPVRCRKCAYVWHAFGEEPEEDKLPKDPRHSVIGR